MLRTELSTLVIVVGLSSACAPQPVFRTAEVADTDGRSQNGGPASPTDARDAGPDVSGSEGSGGVSSIDGAPPASAERRDGPLPIGEPPPSASNVALLVVRSIAPVRSDDAKLAARLQGKGFVVRLAADSDSPVQAPDVDVVVISGSSRSATVAAKYTAAAVPVVCLEPDTFGRMRMTGTADGSSGEATTSQLTITSQDHRMAAGKTGTFAVTTAAEDLGWGVPAASAARVAAIAGMQGRYAVFSYEKGTAMFGMMAPARRAALFIQNTLAERLTPAGWQMFDAAIDWAVGR
jgi:hypothetical protein